MNLSELELKGLETIIDELVNAKLKQFGTMVPLEDDKDPFKPWEAGPPVKYLKSISQIVSIEADPPLQPVLGDGSLEGFHCHGDPTVIKITLSNGKKQTHNYNRCRFLRVRNGMIYLPENDPI